MTGTRFRAILLIALLMTAGLAGTTGAAPVQEPDAASVPRITVDELILLLARKRPVTIIDDRNPDSYTHKIKGALQIPKDELEARIKEIPRNREIVTYCA